MTFSLPLIMSASSPVAPGEFDVTSPVKLGRKTSQGLLLYRYRARFQVSSSHSDGGNWPGDKAVIDYILHHAQSNGEITRRRPVFNVGL